MENTKGNIPTPSVDEVDESVLENYEVIRFVSKGSFGQVIKCLKKDTGDVVAVKIPLYKQDTEKEISLLREMMEEGMDQRHIVKFFEAFNTPFGKGMVFEMLDISLLKYFNTYKPLPLSDIRAITKQIAIALEALMNLSVIHRDIKLDNVMVSTQKPLCVKLIDFGLATRTSEAEQGSSFFPVCYRPPEVILGLPYNEAVDVWTLGTLVAILVFNFELFPNNTEYETLKIIMKLFGTPSRVYLDQGLMTEKYFERNGQSWIFWTDPEILDEYGYKSMYYTEKFMSLRDLIEFEKCSSLEEDRELEAAISLLGRMLEIYPDKRITPSEILQHPFICGKWEPTESSTTERCVDEEDDNECNELLTCKINMDGTQRITPAQILEHNFICMERRMEELVEEKQVDSIQKTSMKEPVVISVKPAKPENTVPFTDDDQLSKSMTSQVKGSPDIVMKIETPNQKETMSTPGPMIIAFENIVSPEEGNEQCYSPKKKKKRRWKNRVAPMSTEQPTSGSTGSPKKRNYFQRIFSWLKRVNCFSCATAE